MVLLVDGNDGPDASTVGAPAWVPWLTAVGASTHDRAFLSEITLSKEDDSPLIVWGAMGGAVSVQGLETQSVRHSP